MKTEKPTWLLRLQPETMRELSKLRGGVVATDAAFYGYNHGEPLLVAMDAMLRYAKAHRARYEAPLAEDYVLGEYWRASIDGLRRLLNGDGAVAMEPPARNTDSKDNGMLEEVYWLAIEAAGFKRE